jgi:hypothetical protein
MLRKEIIALALLAPVAVQAQPATAVGEAEQRFNNGIALYERHDYTAAYEEFRLAYELTKRWEVLFNLGVTAQRLARYRDAVHMLDRYLQEGGDAVPADRRAAVVAAEEDIQRVVAVVSVVVTGAPAKLDVDGHSEGMTPLDGPLLLTSGSHTLIATRGKEVDQKTIEVQSGNRLDVQLSPRALTIAHVTVRSLPDGAQLTLDARPLGRAPWIGDVEKGGHTLGATLTGYLDARQEITLEGGQERDVRLDLERIPPRWYEHWYVIAAAGAIVIAGGVAIYYGTRVDGIEYSP